MDVAAPLASGATQRPWPQDEVKRILSQLGEKLSAREVEAILAEADPRRSGQVPYDFFVGMVKAF